MKREILAESALQEVGIDGYFILDSRRSWRRQELTAAEAQPLADVFLSRTASTLPSWFARHHDAAIDFAALQRCGRVIYAASPYVEPAVGEPEWLVNLASPRWFFSYCAPDGTPAMSVAVATTATHLRVANGLIDQASVRGNEFDVSGIPKGAMLPLSPERAAEDVARVSGRKISAAPMLVLAGRPYFAQAARWRFELDDVAALVDGRGTARTTREIFIGSARKGWDAEMSIRDDRENRSADTLYLPSKDVVILRRSDALPGSFVPVATRGGDQ